MAAHTFSPTPESSRKFSLEEELLPSYEQSALDSVPEVEATPEQVRDFLRRLLVTKRELSVDHAERVAAKWTTGSGQELRSYPPLMYFEIFGREDGWAVYKEAKLFIYTCDRDAAHDTEAPMQFRCAVCGALFALKAFIIYTIVRQTTAADGSSGVLIFAWFCLLIATACLLASLADCITGCLAVSKPKERDLEKKLQERSLKDKEETIEKELQECIAAMMAPKTAVVAR